MGGALLGLLAAPCSPAGRDAPVGIEVCQLTRPWCLALEVRGDGGSFKALEASPQSLAVRAEKLGALDASQRTACRGLAHAVRAAARADRATAGPEEGDVVTLRVFNTSSPVAITGLLHRLEAPLRGCVETLLAAAERTPAQAPAAGYLRAELLRPEQVARLKQRGTLPALAVASLSPAARVRAEAAAAVPGSYIALSAAELAALGGRGGQWLLEVPPHSLELSLLAAWSGSAPSLH